MKNILETSRTTEADVKALASLMDDLLFDDWADIQEFLTLFFETSLAGSLTDNIQRAKFTGIIEADHILLKEFVRIGSTEEFSPDFSQFDDPSNAKSCWAAWTNHNEDFKPSIELTNKDAFHLSLMAKLLQIQLLVEGGEAITHVTDVTQQQVDAAVERFFDPLNLSQDKGPDGPFDYEDYEQLIDPFGMLQDL